MRNWIINNFGIDFVKDFNVFISGVLVGLILGFIATQLDIARDVDRGFVNSLFYGKVDIIKKEGNK